jgi:hypothetical protein
MKYYIALADCNGDWDILDEFDADSDAEAEKRAEEDFADQDWYVLDEKKNNINA